MAVEAQCRPKADTAPATASTDAPFPPSSVGTSASMKPSARSASIASDGKRANRSTSSAAGPATSTPMRWALRASSAANSGSEATSGGGRSDELHDRAPDRGDGFEGAPAEHALGELDVEGLFEGEDHVDTGVGRHPGIEDVVVVAEGRGVDGELGELGQHATNRVVDLH